MSKFPILDEINSPLDLRKLSLSDRKQLVKELREEIIIDVAKTGGHLASNLGVVELTIAIHKVFDTPKDKVIWDVGHQTYIHKILTGRRKEMKTLRQFEGISGFPKISESNYDVFNTGHSSTSISAALGMARARDIMNDDYHVIAVIGDGSLTGGMALEALNDAGASKTNLIVILNDNEMSIEANSGGLANLLSKTRNKAFYMDSNRTIKKIVLKVPYIGNTIVKFVRRIKYALKHAIMPNMYFEDIGFTYLGPVDANDLEKIESLLYRAKDLKGPILIHAKTKKGKGYAFAEENPDCYHGVGTFDYKTGIDLNTTKNDYSSVFGNKLCEIAKSNKKVIAITAAMASGTGLSRFKNEFPNRFFDVEIAEQHAITMAAGASIGGLIPVVAIYSSFMQRAFDQLIHDVCMQNLHVVICLDRAGIVGADGETHQGLYDLAFTHLIPNLTIFAPKDFNELEDMLEVAINSMNTPVIIRYPRGKEGFSFNTDRNLQKNRLINFKSELLQSGNDLTIISIGKMVTYGMDVADNLHFIGVNADVINISVMKPLDEEMIIKSIKKTKKLITIEDGTIIGGLHASVLDLISKYNLRSIKEYGFAYPDEYIKQGEISQIENQFNLTSEKITNTIIKMWYKNN